MIEIEMIADRNQNVAGTRADGFGSKLTLEFEIELVHLDMRGTAMAGATL